MGIHFAILTLDSSAYY